MSHERIKGLTKCAAVSILYIGMSYASYKSGFTESMLHYDWMTRAVAYEAHRQYPLLCWSDYGNPGTLEQYTDNAFNKISASAAGGLLGLVFLGCSRFAVEMRKDSVYR